LCIYTTMADTPVQWRRGKPASTIRSYYVMEHYRERRRLKAGEVDAVVVTGVTAEAGSVKDLQYPDVRRQFIDFLAMAHWHSYLADGNPAPHLFLDFRPRRLDRAFHWKGLVRTRGEMTDLNAV
ncbi:MAG: hypothetical protein AAF714_00985, partial [Pseudomonadota bacterium]